MTVAVLFVVIVVDDEDEDVGDDVGDTLFTLLDGVLLRKSSLMLVSILQSGAFSAVSLKAAAISPLNCNKQPKAPK